jgi:hypothetical protein
VRLKRKVPQPSSTAAEAPPVESEIGQEFAGYWKYLLKEAIFTAPGHPNWGGTALIGSKGELLGIGSLQLQAATAGGATLPLNMIVPIDLLTPIVLAVAAGRSARWQVSSAVSGHWATQVWTFLSNHAPAACSTAHHLRGPQAFSKCHACTDLYRRIPCRGHEKLLPRWI